MNKYELLAPAGDVERAKYSLVYGADAVFLGAKQFSLRARASNFEIEDIKSIIKFAHERNKKVYLVTNVICHNFMIKEFKDFFDVITKIGIDAFIVADPFIIYNLRKFYPDVEIHVSTQQSITNSKSAAFFKRAGATRVVLAREMKYEEIELLCEHNNGNVEIEAFIHGAVCIAYSGRCMMSNNYSLRDANVGGCAQSCRWLYKIIDSDVNKFFTMSAKDMSYLLHLNKLMKLDIASFKVEGRMKTINYLTTVMKTYRTAIDSILNNSNCDMNQLKHSLDTVANRETDSAFLECADSTKMLYHDEEKKLKQDFAFVINKMITKNEFKITSKNYFDINMKIYIVKPNGPNEFIQIESITDSDGKNFDIVNTPMREYVIKTKGTHNFDEYCIGRIKYE
ncbi:MAG: U32 family peptidase C-terminal domain-containing protein [Mycoplasma sp.]